VSQTGLPNLSTKLDLSSLALTPHLFLATIRLEGKEPVVDH
jgi:hypothetical protein